MSSQNGKRVVCDRCGEQVFVKTIGDGEMDGGFTRWNKFDPLPNGWGYHKGKDMCPACSSAWNKIESAFMNQELNFFKKADSR